jgi:hypothetical protein
LATSPEARVIAFLGHAPGTTASRRADTKALLLAPNARLLAIDFHKLTAAQRQESPVGGESPNAAPQLSSFQGREWFAPVGIENYGRRAGPKHDKTAAVG